MYAASKKQRKRTRFALPLENVTSVAAWHDADSFVVASARGNEFTLRASSVPIAQDWMAAIRGAVEKRRRDRHKVLREEDYLDASERAKVEALRVRCKDDPCLQRDHLLEDANLVRFVRARDGNVSKAEKMLRDHGQWRDDYGFPALLAAGKTPEDAFIERWWPDGLLEGSDLKGRPVQLIRLGKADLPGIEREVGSKKWIEYCCLKNEALFEEIRKRCFAQNTFETSAPLIMDMRDLGTHHAWGVPLFKAMLDVTEPNFPERLSATYIVNARGPRPNAPAMSSRRRRLYGRWSRGQGLPEPGDGGESASFWRFGRSPEGAARGHAPIDDTYRPRWGGAVAEERVGGRHRAEGSVSGPPADPRSRTGLGRLRHAGGRGGNVSHNTYFGHPRAPRKGPRLACACQQFPPFFLGRDLVGGKTRVPGARPRDRPDHLTTGQFRSRSQPQAHVVRRDGQIPRDLG